MSRVQTVTIQPDDADQRLDRWFKRQFPQISQGRLEKMCRKGEIRVDGGRVKASTRLEAGQSIRVPVEGISFRSRSAGGVKVFNTGKGEEVVSVAWIAEQNEEAEEGGAEE